jgi:hypothetical protein
MGNKLMRALEEPLTEEGLKALDIEDESEHSDPLWEMAMSEETISLRDYKKSRQKAIPL